MHLSIDMDLADWLTVIGLVLLGFAIWLAWGLAAMTAYAGVVAVMAGAVFAYLNRNGR